MSTAAPTRQVLADIAAMPDAELSDQEALCAEEAFDLAVDLRWGAPSASQRRYAERVMSWLPQRLDALRAEQARRASAAKEV